MQRIIFAGWHRQATLQSTQNIIRKKAKKIGVPNQRQVSVHKEECSKKNKYTANNLAALDEAALILQSKGGFKLYMYMAKNQDNYSFELSSSDFMHWSGLGYSAYTTAFKELEDKKYLIPKEGKENVYTFYDKAQIPEEKVKIEVPEEKVKEVKEALEGFSF